MTAAEGEAEEAMGVEGADAGELRKLSTLKYGRRTEDA